MEGGGGRTSKTESGGGGDKFWWGRDHCRGTSQITRDLPRGGGQIPGGGGQIPATPEVKVHVSFVECLEILWKT